MAFKRRGVLETGAPKVHEVQGRDVWAASGELKLEQDKRRHPLSESRHHEFHAHRQVGNAAFANYVDQSKQIHNSARALCS